MVQKTNTQAKTLNLQSSSQILKYLVIFPSPMLIWVCSHFRAPKYARLNIGEGEQHI